LLFAQMNVYTIPGGRLSHTPPEPPPNVEQYSLNQLPRKLLPRYNHLVSFVKTVKAKTIKLTFFAHDATCNLMESLEDFVVVFHSGEFAANKSEVFKTMHVSKYKVLFQD